MFNITTEQYGSYVDLESLAIRDWNISLQHPHCRPSLDLAGSKLEQLKTEYRDELAALVTERGVWNDIITYFAIGKKKE